MSSKKQSSNSSKAEDQQDQLKPRNSLSLHPLMKKSHVHAKSAKAERAKDKQALKKELRQHEKLD